MVQFNPIGRNFELTWKKGFVKMTQGNSETDSLLRSAEQRLRRLSLDRLRVAEDFLAYLEEKEADAATLELLSLDGFEDAFRQALQQAETGQVVRFTDIRRDV